MVHTGKFFDKQISNFELQTRRRSTYRNNLKRGSFNINNEPEKLERYLLQTLRRVERTNLEKAGIPEAYFLYNITSSLKSTTKETFYHQR